MELGACRGGLLVVAPRLMTDVMPARPSRAPMISRTSVVSPRTMLPTCGTTWAFMSVLSFRWLAASCGRWPWLVRVSILSAVGRLRREGPLVPYESREIGQRPAIWCPKPSRSVPKAQPFGGAGQHSPMATLSLSAKGQTRCKAGTQSHGTHAVSRATEREAASCSEHTHWRSPRGCPHCVLGCGRGLSGLRMFRKRRVGCSLCSPWCPLCSRCRRLSR